MFHLLCETVCGLWLLFDVAFAVFLKHWVPLNVWVHTVDFRMLVSLWKSKNANWPIICKLYQYITTTANLIGQFFFLCFRDETSNLKLTVCLWKSHTTYGSKAHILHMRTQQNMAYPLHIVRGPGGSSSGARKWSTRPWHLLHSCVTLASSRGEALGLPRYPDNLACIVVLASVGNAPSNASLTANGSFNWKALPARLHGGAPRGSWEVTSHRIDKIQDD